MVQILGKSKLDECCKKYHLKIQKVAEKLMKKHQGNLERQPWTNFVNQKNIKQCSSDALELLNKML